MHLQAGRNQRQDGAVDFRELDDFKSLFPAVCSLFLCTLKSSSISLMSHDSEMDGIVEDECTQAGLVLCKVAERRLQVLDSH